MEFELSKAHQSQQDMDLIDILWRQDIDLGAAREVFDVRSRQKEHDLRRQRELEEEKRLQLLREKEKALLDDLQLDEETGEFVPRPVTGDNARVTETAATAAEVNQTTLFPPSEGDALSFDECMQLLAETFPLVEAIEPAPPPLDLLVGNISAGAGPPQTMTRQPSPVDQNPMLLALLAPPQKALPAPTASPDVEEAWMELLSLPELQQCLNMNVSDILEPSVYTPLDPEVHDSDYSFFLPELPGPSATLTMTDTVCTPDYMDNFQVAFNGVVPPDNLNQMTLKAPELGAGFVQADRFHELLYPDPSTEPSRSIYAAGSSTTSCPLGELLPLEPMEVPEGVAEGRKSPEAAPDLQDSDSGVSLDAGSPGKSHPSDSDTEEMDSGPASVESEYREMFPLMSLGPDLRPSTPCTTSSPPPCPDEPVGASAPDEPPLTRDKRKRRAQSRLSRDVQRAGALRIPFAVELIINLPVDDFNELMTRHVLDEAQLALVRDIRRRGKNKVAAQNCRKRKMESISGLEGELDSLRDEREHLLKEKAERGASLREVKRQLSALYLEVFSLLHDEEGKPYSPREYSLQQTADGNVFLVPRVKKTLERDGN